MSNTSSALVDLMGVAIVADVATKIIRPVKKKKLKKTKDSFLS